MKLPLQEERLHELGNSFNKAYRCLLQLESKFQKDTLLHNQYKTFIHEFIQLGHAQYIPNFSATDPHTFYLPHHAVLKPDSLTTKLRTVFNGSAPSSTGISLNDILLEGPNIYNDVIDILLRFRLHKYAFSCDIVKMFRAIFVHPEHRPLQRVLWRDSKSDPLQCLELTTVTYGTKCAPYLACRTLQDLAEKHKNTHSLASECMVSDSLMDDFLSGGPSMQHVHQLCSELIDVLSKAGFQLHKWAANDPAILQHVQCSDIDLESHSYDFPPNDVSKTLGLKWQTTCDTLQVSIPEFTNINYTKRNVLSQISKIFDPIGILAPTTVLAKLLMQDIWKGLTDWDEPISPELQKKWYNLYSQLHHLKSIQIPRYYFSDLPSEIILIGFCDASAKAYGACIYLLAKYNNKCQSCTLVMAKTKVAPLARAQSIPRLELSGALLLAQIISKFITVTKNKINLHDTYLFTDSSTVLHWIQSPYKKYHTYVSHRLMEILELTAKDNWYYINTTQNPADLLTRGVAPQDLPAHPLWWHGPTWLLQDNQSWPLTTSPVNLQSQEDTLPTTPICKTAHVTTDLQENYFYNTFCKFSCYTKLIRVIAYIKRFIHNIKNKDSKLTSHLSVSELIDSRNFIINVVQTISFHKEFTELQSLKQTKHLNANASIPTTQLYTFKSSPLRFLNPFLDENNIIRVGGRIGQSDNIPYSQAHPIILPAKEHFTTLLINYYHIKLLHSGIQNTLANIRLNFWLIHGRNEVKKVIHNCIRCVRYRAQVCGQQMSELPAPRVSLTRAFTHTGVDFSGAISIRTSMTRNCKYIKGYICLFVCLATRAIHLELVTDLSSQAFICALKRFISRRGICRYLYSDNGTNFKGANHDLHDLYVMFKKDSNYSEIVDFCTHNLIQFKFTVPLASHMGGIYEAGIKSVKSLLKRHLLNTKLTYELLYTVLIQIEGILNSRPICAMSDMPNDLTCLTPSHFLIGSPITDIPEPDYLNLNENRLDTYKKVTQIKQKFWKQFYNTYLSELQPRNKWLHVKANLKVGELVIIKEDNIPATFWPLARIITVHRNKNDNLIRSVTLKTTKGTYSRPIHKLILLPCHS